MSAPVREGDILAGKYRVERILGEGGMGVVVRAHHVQLDQRVALKFLHPNALGSADATERFAREARAAAKIKSPHVARVIDVGVLEGGAPYMVMEYLEGADLASVARDRGPFAPDDVARYALEACEALAEAHAAGIVHRDLKPANLFLAKQPDGSEMIKVLDFGVSKNVAPSESSPEAALTKTASVVGSLMYMPPEQMRSARDVDARADVWSLGATMFQLLTGVPPFNGDSLAEIVDAVRREPPRSMRALRPEVPDGFVAVVLKCLEKEPKDRWPDVAELARAIAPFAPADARRSADKAASMLLAKQRTAASGPPPEKRAHASGSGSGSSSDDAFAATEADASGDRTESLPNAGEISRGTSAWAKSGSKRTMPPGARRWAVRVAVGAVAVFGVTVVWRVATAPRDQEHLLVPSAAPSIVILAPGPTAAETASASPTATASAPPSAAPSASSAPAKPRRLPPPPASASAAPSATSPTNPLHIQLK